MSRCSAGDARLLRRRPVAPTIARPTAVNAAAIASSVPSFDPDTGRVGSSTIGDAAGVTGMTGMTGVTGVTGVTGATEVTGVAGTTGIGETVALSPVSLHAPATAALLPSPL